MKKLFLLISAVYGVTAFAQNAVNYQTPNATITQLALAKPTPSISVDRNAEWMLVSERNSFPAVEELGQPEVRVAGLRINPANFSLSRQNYINNLYLQQISTSKTYTITGLPANLQATTAIWNDAQNKIAFTNVTAKGVDIYVIDVATQKATKQNKTFVNIVLGAPFIWLNNNTILYKTIIQPATALPKKPITPQGPTIQENYGKASPRPTFQDLIKSPYDETLFTFLTQTQLVKNTNSVEVKLGTPKIYTGISVAPNQAYLMLRTITAPFSYTVPAQGFAQNISITDVGGKVVKNLFDVPSAETAPAGNDNVQEVPRNITWRDDEAATITFAKPLDGGLIKNTAEFRDAVYQIPAPFTTEPTVIFKTKNRYAGTNWGNANFALVYEVLRGKQKEWLSQLNPTTGTLDILQERSSNDAYADLGNPVTTRNQFGKEVVLPQNNRLLMNNPVGASPNGDMPFLAYYNLTTKQNNILWRCPPQSFEVVTAIINTQNLQVITRAETPSNVPNYYLKTLRANSNEGRAITNFTNPYPALQNVTKQKVNYKRADGVDLTADLYTPKHYNPTTSGTLPVIIWAYPREFTNAADAAQVRGSKFTFTRLNWGSPIYWATQGFAVLDNAEMPIVSTTPNKKPNDDFIAQLKLNARAAIDFIAANGLGDTTRVAVGGHSYGAFMTANLLAHTNWFKAGIARSGAYNRTLTPFSFQNEDRTYWQAPQLYFDMSPFNYAHQLKTPILLVHGDSDDNTGTFPIQSERLFAALKGNGGNVRYVSLPYEAHGYRGKENILHLLWEEDQWLQKWLKK
jgi:dipeptidyl aminopeptidase/acylaminoacyl peptidase